jgi:superfamily II DNA or RNA helicase
LKHLASLHNAEFYDKQRMGFSVWKTPRFLRCYEETLEHLYLPRGVQDQAKSIIEETAARLEIRDVRPVPTRLELSFGGTLRDDTQEKAVEVMARHELGVLVAQPGAGKTVMACALIARHATPALVLVDRAPLLRQWQEQLRTFLGLPAERIGQIGAGKSRRTGVVDLAMLQTLARHDDPAAMLDGYGLVVVDECHHVAAETFEAAIKNIAARRWLGLTATPKRADHREEIMFMHCGPVRHRIAAGSNLAKALIIHPTGFTIRDDIDGDVPGLLSSIILPALVTDRERARQVCSDVAQAAKRGRNCLVLTGRTGHVSFLAEELRSRGLAPLELHGSLKPRQRLAVLDQLSYGSCRSL